MARFLIAIVMTDFREAIHSFLASFWSLNLEKSLCLDLLACLAPVSDKFSMGKQTFT
jgi:hypothetical protein